MRQRLITTLAAITTAMAPVAAAAVPARDQCQVWADGVWPQEVGVRERELRNRGCRDAGDDRWEPSGDGCARRAFSLARQGIVGAELSERVAEFSCVQDDDGTWGRSPRPRRSAER